MAKKSESNLGTFTPTGQPVCEEGVHYAKGDIMELTPERAEALGSLVAPVERPKAPAGE